MVSDDKLIDKFQYYLVGNKAGYMNEWKSFCPLHENPQTSKTPSASINFVDKVWFCQACGEGGTLNQLVRAMKNIDPNNPPGDISGAEKPQPRTSTSTPSKPLPDERQIRYWMRALRANEAALKVMHEKRGLTDETLKRFRIGYDGQRFTLPVYDADGELVNVRRYKPNAKGADKMISWGAGWGTGRILNPKEVESWDDVILCEGELDYIIARQYKLNATSSTSGAQTFKPEWAQLFNGKRVYVAYDEDKAGDDGAIKVASILKNTAESVHRIKLGTGIKSGDVTDYFTAIGGDHDSFIQLMDEAKLLWEAPSARNIPTTGLPVSVEESQNVEHADKALELTVMVIGKQTPAYLGPKQITATCDQSAGAACSVCPLAVNEGKLTVQIAPDDDRLLNFVNASDKRVGELQSQMVGAKCTKHVEYGIDEGYNIEELVVSPSVDFRTEETETPINRRVFNIGTYKTPINQTVKIVGKQVPDPATQRGTFMGWNIDHVAQDLDEFRMTPETRKALEVFQPGAGQSPFDKCMEIVADLSTNVTHIYGRELMHLGMDLVWHSASTFNFDEKPVRKGWLEALVLGDTRTGKSEAVTALRRHYGAGIIKSCEGATFAGLVGGAQQVPGSRSGWIVTWGTLPLNDRRLVILDEMSGLMANRDAHILGDMSSIRSEGKATITKIVSEETSARTRIIWLSNPSTGERLSDSPGSALDALQQLIRNPEDIARFDYALAVANNEVSSSVINSSQHAEVPHVYTSDLSNALVTWIWSRKAEDVRWGVGAEMAVLNAAEDLGNRYIPTPPLIQVENIRVKVARLAVAFAARTFSTDAKGEQIYVRKAHVAAAVRFLNEIYGTDAMGYLRASRRAIADQAEANTNKKAARKYLEENPDLLGAIRAIGNRSFRPRDFEESAAMDKFEASQTVQTLLAWKMITRENAGKLRFEKAMMELLRDLEDERFRRGDS